MLSKDQSAAVQHFKGPAMVFAGPGSGKTMVITHRIKRLIERGVRPENILVITFTRAAATQMRERFDRLVSPDRFRATFGTFHAVFFQILKNAYGYTDNNILRSEESLQILKQIVQSLHIDCGDFGEWACDVLGEISKVKSERIPIDYYYAASCPEEEFRAVYRLYVRRQRELNKIDFDDMCVYTHDLFHSRPDILKAWQDHFQYILVDEFQDINSIQYQIVRMLAKPDNNLFIVGDDDQSIYRFRGSRPEIMLQFPRDYSGTAVFKLRENYRSTAAIVNASLRVISENKTRYPKELFSRREGGAPVEVLECRDPETEMLYLVRTIRKRLDEGGEPSRIAVLTRTNLETRRPAAKLAEFQIPCALRNSVPALWDHWIAKDIISYLKLSEGPMKREDFVRVCNRPNRYITRQSAYADTITFPGLYAWYRDKPWMREHLTEFEQTLRMIRSMRPYAAVNYIRKGGGYDAFIQEYARKRKLDFDELTGTADEIQDSTRGCETLGQWLEKIENEKEEVLRQRQDCQRRRSNCVTLATLHSAKGLEFDEVFILNANEGVIPYRRVSLDADLEEERRLFYVGITRARDRLHILYLKERYNKVMEPSRFLECLKG